MPEYCTCGTKLVENARFCHRCGRSTLDEVVVEAPVVVPDAAPVLQAKLAPVPVGFGNPIALRVAFLMSLAIMMVEVIPILNRLFLVWWVGAGWCAVLLYRRLTGLSLTVPAGARLGSITGVLTFVSITVLLSLTMFFTGKEVFDQMVQQNPAMSEVIANPPVLAGLFLLVLAVVFVLVVGFCAAGGALGARFSAHKANT